MMEFSPWTLYGPPTASSPLGGEGAAAGGFTCPAITPVPLGRLLASTVRFTIVSGPNRSQLLGTAGVVGAVRRPCGCWWPLSTLSVHSLASGPLVWYCAALNLYGYRSVPPVPDSPTSNWKSVERVGSKV